MGKHNGKARKTGLSVGSALVNKARRDGKVGPAAHYMYTTDTATNMQSVLEGSDLQEMMNLADLAGREFQGEKEHAVVITMGSATVIDVERAAEERTLAEDRHRHRLRIPRRPKWKPGKTSPEQLDELERASFLEWRRDLAAMETDERLVLTPFEKNLEVWRQLWRVVERSDAVVQVVDARDPLTYRSEDLEAYCRETHATKQNLLLLNKSDLLPEKLRSAWADYFDAQGVRYVFWSARAAAEAQDSDAPVNPIKCKDPRAALLDSDGLIDLLESLAQECIADAEKLGLPRASRSGRPVVGLTGYPNVGKSSTINALFGSKKTAVAATPGKTKHFQTLNISDDLCLCDCPGLVMPRFARSKAEMVAAGVVPVDRLTDIRAPVAAVAQRVSREQLEKAYAIRLPKPAVNEAPDRPPTAPELLRSLAGSRGWMGASGHPDETRAGRKILKDYVDGKILYCTPPPNASTEVLLLADEISGRPAAGPLQFTKPQTQVPPQKPSESINEDSESSGQDQEEEEAVAAAMDPAIAAQLEEQLDLELMASMQISGNNKKPKPVRAEHKFHKKPSRAKARTTSNENPYEDGNTETAFVQGKRGGLVRSSVY